jgi:hypothetical protein
MALFLHQLYRGEYETVAKRLHAQLHCAPTHDVYSKKVGKRVA